MYKPGIPDYRKMTKLAEDLGVSLKKLLKAIDDLNKTVLRLNTQLDKNTKAISEMQKKMSEQITYTQNIYGPEAKTSPIISEDKGEIL